MTARRVSQLFIIIAGLGCLFAVGILTGYKYPGVVGLSARYQGLSARDSTDPANKGLSSLITETNDAHVFDIFWDVWELAEAKHYASPADPKTLMYGAINGVLQYGLKDQYSSFITPAIRAKMTDSLGGNDAGIGLEMDKNARQITVVTALVSSPAERAGLLPGDIITSIDDAYTEEMSVLEAASLIRGPLGTDVTLGILRYLDDGTFEELTVPVTRSRVVEETLSWRDLGNGIFYIKLRSLNPDTITQWTNAVSVINSSSPAGIILDIRSNAGGSTNPVLTVVSEFVQEGVVYKLDRGEGDTSEIQVSGSGSLFEVPLRVLVNRGTASAAEMIAGSLADHERARLLGERTFGKGVMQDIIDINVPGEVGPGALNLVVAKWYTPTGTWIQDMGIAPDLEVRSPASLTSAEDPVQDQAYLELTETGIETSQP
ncbi:hypothetical protein AUK40_06735 [Candidatus Wirthbacteria bacterium CG2_30_54_11]|uniref:PDZ domain-containing protein n=1 Tax=Candidatus Wirthbacteria bacterium CG2_30_54_11 TaxID=1817892 RepID=A0A1J5ID86_9BACT|nr:MAG: hypothetical protein AUK40_06735 [Candidatus Wirthbacteria bacterium CG2_30_54_11]